MKIIAFVDDESPVWRDDLPTVTTKLRSTIGLPVRAELFKVTEVPPTTTPRSETPTEIISPPPTGVVILFIEGGDRAVAEQVRMAIAATAAVEVRETIQLDDPTAGDHPDSVIRIGVNTRVATITRDEFDRHWVQGHGPLVVSRGPGFVRYVTNVTVDPSVPFDGVVEQYYPNFAAFVEHIRQVREEKPDVLADAASFSDIVQNVFVRRVARAASA